jgi:hypothetical protein
MDYQTIMKLYEIWDKINLKVEEHIYNFFFIFKIFYIYLMIHCQNYQNNLLSMNPHSLIIYTCIYGLYSLP